MHTAMPISREQLSGFYDVKIDVNPEEQFDRQVLTSLFQITAPAVQDYPIGLRIMLKQLWTTFNQRGFDAIYPEELALLQTQQRMMAIQVQLATFEGQLRQLDQAIAAADAARRAAAAGQQPTIALAADYGMQGVDYTVGRDDDFSSVSLVLNWTLWDFGARAGKRRQAEAETERLRAERRDLEHKLAIAQWSATESLQLALRSIDAASARVAAAEEVFRIAERKRAAASLSQVEFIDAQRSQTEARLNLAIARCEVLDRAAELELANASFPLNAVQRTASPAVANTSSARSAPRLASKLTSSLSNSPAAKPE